MASWRERMRGETDKAWKAFQMYRDMPPVGEGARSQALLSERLGYESTRSVEVWSSKFNWTDRVKAYDDYMAEKSIVLREADLEQYQNEVVRRDTESATLVSDVIMRAIFQIRDAQIAGDEVDTMDIKRLTSAMRDVSDIMRRAGKMATSFRSEESDDDDAEQTIFTIGG